MEIQPTWQQIHELEMREEYPQAIDALEARLASNPDDEEVVIRLGFNLWYAVVEATRLGVNKRFGDYPERFSQLYAQYRERFQNSADFCWAFGLGISMFWFYFPGLTEEEGQALLTRARELDPLWANLFQPGTNMSRLKGRGIFQRYYNVQK